MTPDPNRKKTLREKLRYVFKNVSKADAKELAKDTLRDLKDPKELGALLVAILVPAGLPAYAAWRIHKYRVKKAANDNTKNDKNPAPTTKTSQKKPPDPKP